MTDLHEAYEAAIVNGSDVVRCPECGNKVEVRDMYGDHCWSCDAAEKAGDAVDRAYDRLREARW